ncbi:uncharacterized protein A1O5_06910 [Cladophialophora psammophila CBS 110553]|uniref:Zn(2)-C6 fungal-type domain-containing protein n=1 Tax=Cladophialophora psammophila CBS 110553 TaxID=1182543 RepID=W9WPM0_9EURO|nr:uncharacterized protein A1O5_06910 [Cladophialophora psammophila CBS 110553]EXJ69838.1 hypothetical protein A1O5_06910 [Cladophialophora psammophila CBS 110553]
MATTHLPLHETLTKRAGRACLTCRSRKIRCNVEERGPPCSNCLTDDVHCQTARSKRGKKPRPRLKTNSSRNAGPKHGAIIPDVGALDSCSRAIIAPSCRGRVSPTHTTGWLDDSVDMDMFSQSCIQATTAPEQSSATAQLDARFLHQELSYASLVDKEAVHNRMNNNAALTPRSLTAVSQPSPTSAASLRTTHDGLPDIVTPLSQSLSLDDINYLRLKGALDLPSAGFLKALLTAYIQFVHPYMPTIDLSTIRGALTGETASIGILPLQAIVFASVPFVDISEIQRAGFNSRRACRKAFYERTRLLYDHDVETDKLAIIQAVLLMAYWSEYPGDNRGAWYWMGIAITLAQTLGMHRKAEYKVQSQDAKLHKRVWWSCFIRDRMLAIAMGRPLRIKEAEFDTPALTLEDFDIVDLSSISEKVLLTMVDQIALAQMCIKSTELCKLGAEVLELHFSVLPSEKSTSTAKGDNGSTATMMFLKSGTSNEQLVQKYDEELQAWYRTLPASCVYRAQAGQEGYSPCVITNAASLHITFWSVVSALHRPQLRNRDKARSVKRVEEAAIEVSRVDREMHKSQLDRYLPATAGIPFQFTAFITHTKRLESQTTSDVTTEILASLFFCIKVLETSREAFPGGDAGGDFLTYIAIMANVTLLFNQESKLWGVEYRGVHYSPGSRQLNLSSSCFGAEFGETSPPPQLHQHQHPQQQQQQQQTPPDTVPSTNHEPRKSGRMDTTQNNAELLASFENTDLIDRASLADILPVCNIDYDHSFAMLVNLDYLGDVEMVG